MQITEIKKIGKGERYSIYIDGKFDCAIEAEILVREKLKTDQEIEEEMWQKIKLENGKLACFSRAISYVEKGLRTEKQMREYLKQKGFLPESIGLAIEKLKEYNFLDDEMYAESYIKTYQSRKGKLKLKFELQQKGVDGEIIIAKLDELLDEDESLQTCKNLLEKYLKNRPLDQKLKAKAYAHLLGKGFESGLVIRAISEVKK